MQFLSKAQRAQTSAGMPITLVFSLFSLVSILVKSLFSLISLLDRGKGQIFLFLKACHARVLGLFSIKQIHCIGSDRPRGRPSSFWKSSKILLFSLLFMFVNGAYCFSDEKGTFCDNFSHEHQYKAISDSDLSQYCKHKCSSMRDIVCDENVAGTSFILEFDWLNTFFKIVEEHRIDHKYTVISPQVSLFSTIDFVLVKEFMFLLVVPILVLVTILSIMIRDLPPYCRYFLAVVTVLVAFFRDGSAVATYTFVLLVINFSLGTNTLLQMMSSTSLALIIAGVLSSAIHKAWLFQFTVASLLAIVFFAAVYSFSRTKTNADAMGALVVVMVMLISTPAVGKVVSSKGGNSLFIRLFTFGINSALPVGKTPWFFINAFSNVGDLDSFLGREMPNVGYMQREMFYTCYFIGWFIFFSIRSSVGWNVARKVLKAPAGTQDLDMMFKVYGCGLYLYMVDVVRAPWDALRFLYCRFTGVKVSQHMLFYTWAVLLLTVFEYYYAFEFLSLRIVLRVFDYFVSPFDVAAGMRMLEAGTESSLNLVSFPKKNSLPFIDSRLIETITSSVVCLTNVSTGAKGKGLMIQDSKGCVWCVTVEHVGFPDMPIKCDNVDATLDFKSSIGGSDDPIVVTPVAGYNGVSAPLVLLTAGELEAVKMIMIIHQDGYHTYDDKFTISKDKGDISVAIDLKSGDSGSPAVAVLNNGSLRYAGAVSRGINCGLTGNLISTVLGKNSRNSGGVRSYSSGETGRDASLAISHPGGPVFTRAMKVLTDFMDARATNVGEATDDDVARLKDMMSILSLTPDQCNMIKNHFDQKKTIDFNMIRRVGTPSGGIGYESYAANYHASMDGLAVGRTPDDPTGAAHSIVPEEQARGGARGRFGRAWGNANPGGRGRGDQRSGGIQFVPASNVPIGNLIDLVQTNETVVTDEAGNVYEVGLNARSGRVHFEVDHDEQQTCSTQVDKSCLSS